MITSEEIKRRLWDGATELRGSMDASRYKDYMLGLMFYKFLSDKTLEAFSDSAGLGKISEELLVEEYSKARKEFGGHLDNTLQEILGYYVLPEYLYQKWVMDIDSGDFELQNVTDSLHNFERTIAVEAENTDFKGLFSSSTIDLTDTALGSNLKERSENIQSLILLFSDLNLVDLQEGDILGDAYEYLIGQFAMESGKKAGEFYTPHQVSEVMARIVSKSSDLKSIYDPTVGAGGLSFGLLEHIHISKLYLVDLREDGLTIAKNRIFNSYPGIVINKIVADVQSVPLSDESVDLIISRGSIRFWEDQLKSLVELRRLLKSGGIMYVGGGRGSVDFQKERSQKDPNWSEGSYSEVFKSGKKLESKMLDDSEYVKLFDTWSDSYAIYNGLGDGHWLSVMKS